MMRRAALMATGLSVLLGPVVGPALGQERVTLSDEVIDKVTEELTRIGDQQRPAIYFEAAPPPEVRAYLEGQGVNIVVATRPATAATPGFPPSAVDLPSVVGTLPPAAGAPYGAFAVRAPSRRDVIRHFLEGVRDLAKILPPDSRLEVDGLTVDLPAGSVHFRLR